MQVLYNMINFVPKKLYVDMEITSRITQDYQGPTKKLHK